MKRAPKIVLDVLTLLLLLGAWVVHYFTMARLGMRRWVNYHVYACQAALPLDVLKYVAAVAVLAAAVAAALWCWRRRDRLGRADAVMVVVMLCLAAFYLAFTAAFTMEALPAYYLCMPIIGLAALMQLIRNLCAAALCTSQEK